MSENQDGVKINQSLTDAFSEFCEISNKTIAHLPLEFSEQSALYWDIYLIRSEFSDGSVMYFPELHVIFRWKELFEPALIPYSLRERYFAYNGPLKDVDDDKEARCQFLLECLKEKEILREMTEMLKFWMRRFFDQNEIGEFLDSQQNKFIGRCDFEEDMIGNGEKIQEFLVHLWSDYEIRFNFYEMTEDEFNEQSLFIDLHFIDKDTGDIHRMNHVFPPYLVDVMLGHAYYDHCDSKRLFETISDIFLDAKYNIELQRKIDMTIEWYEKFVRVPVNTVEI